MWRIEAREDIKILVDNLNKINSSLVANEKLKIENDHLKKQVDKQEKMIDDMKLLIDQQGNKLGEFEKKLTRNSRKN